MGEGMDTMSLPSFTSATRIVRCGVAVALAVIAAALLVGAGTARAADSTSIPHCSRWAAISNDWGDSIDVRACLITYPGLRTVRATAETLARGTQNPVMSCDARLTITITISGTSRPLVLQSAPTYMTQSGPGSCSAEIHRDFVLPAGATAKAHADSLSYFYLGSFSNWYTMKSSDWAGTANSPVVSCPGRYCA
jgi:hypothetical protein